MTLRYTNRPYEALPRQQQDTVDKAFKAMTDVLKEGGMDVYYDDRAENLVDEIALFTRGGE